MKNQYTDRQVCARACARRKTVVQRDFLSKFRMDVKRSKSKKAIMQCDIDEQEGRKIKRSKIITSSIKIS